MSVENKVMVIRKDNWVVVELPNAAVAGKFIGWLVPALKQQVAEKKAAEDVGLRKGTAVEGLGFDRPAAIN